MNDFKIGYVVFGKDEFGYSLSYLMDINGIKAKKATIKTAKYFDVLLFSIFWWAHVYDFWDFCIKAGVGNKNLKTKIIVGGFNSFNPYVFFPMAHKVCVGDGENVILDAIYDKSNKSIFTGVESEVFYNQYDIKNNEYCYTSGGLSRIEIARGCKYKCKFCQLTYLKKYREVDLESIKHAIDKCETRRVSVFAPNGMTHKNYDDIVDYLESKEKINIATDVRYNEIDKYRNNNTATMGLEGISYRLRKKIGKPLDNDGVVEVIKKRIKQCVDRGYQPSIHTYFILDLPGEEKQDWEEFEELLQKVNEIKDAAGLTWIFTGNVFMPSPHTPLENESINLDRDYRIFWRNALSDLKRDKKFNFTIAGRHSIFSPYSRLLSMIATRGGSESGEIIYNIVRNKKLKHLMVGRWEKSLLVLNRFLKNYGGAEQYTTPPKKKPWKIVTF